MDSLHHEKLTVSTGVEDHEVHLCQRCRWPFPNPHPSARHRRSHKRVCGTVKGYEVIHDHKLTVSDDDDDTSDEGQHTPSPKIEKETAPMYGNSGGVGNYSHRSEDDVFSDAITEFLDGGISPQLEERFEQAKGTDTSLEQKTLEGDLSELLEKADETAGPDLEIPVDKSASVPLLTTTAVPVPEAHTNGLTSKEDISRTETQLDESVGSVNKLGDRRAEGELVQEEPDADMLKGENKLASVTLDSEDEKRLDPALVTTEEKEEPCDILVNEVVKLDASPLAESLEKPIATLEKKAVPAEVNGIHNSLETNGHTKTDSHIAIAEETCESTNSSMGISKPSDSAEVGVADSAQGGGFSPPGIKTESQMATEKFAGETVSSSPSEVDIGARHLKEMSKTEDGDSGSQTSLLESKFASTNDVKRVEPVGLDLKDNVQIVESEKKPVPLSEDSEISIKNSGNENNGSQDSARESDYGDAAEVCAKPNPDVVVSCKKSDSPSLEMQEAKILDHEHLEQSSPYTEAGNTSGDNDSNPASSENWSVSPTLKEPVPFLLDVQVRPENSLTNDDNLTVGNKSLKDGVDLQLTKEDDGTSELDLSGENFSISDSLEGKCGSVSDKSEINSQAPKKTSEEPYPNKSDIFESPSFMTLVQPGVNSTSEIETAQQNNNQQAGWFPSLTSVVNESEGRKKNEEIIAKVTNWSQGKQQHGPLKSLLSEAKSQSTKETPVVALYQKDEADNTAEKTSVDSKLGTKDHLPVSSKETEKEWDSPARMEIKKEEKKKKKSKSFWTPFVCCSSVHRDL